MKATPTLAPKRRIFGVMVAMLLGLLALAAPVSAQATTPAPGKTGAVVKSVAPRVMTPNNGDGHHNSQCNTGDACNAELYVVGTGQYVDHVKVSALVLGPNPFKVYVCNQGFNLWAKNPDGSTWGETVYAQCGFGDVYVDVYPHRVFANNSLFCMKLDGRPFNEDACIKIYA